MLSWVNYLTVWVYFLIENFNNYAYHLSHPENWCQHGPQHSVSASKCIAYLLSVSPTDNIQHWFSWLGSYPELEDWREAVHFKMKVETHFIK